GAARRDRHALPARVHARGDRDGARPATRHGELAPAPWPRRAGGGAVKADLERIAIPGEHEARERAWRVLESALAEREPVERQRRVCRPALAVAVAVAALAAVLSSPGRAVLDELREVVGVERAQPALFS